MSEAISDFPVEGPPNGDATRLIRLEKIDRDLFRSRFSEIEWNNHLFGGQVLAQSLAAASATVGGRAAHSLHGYFLTTGSAAQRIIFQVERTRDGGRFSTRRVVAVQDGRSIFHMECSFHAQEAGFAHQKAIPVQVPPPDDLPTLAEAATLLGGSIAADVARMLSRFRLVDVRLTDHEQLIRQEAPVRRRIWVRLPSAGRSDDAGEHQQLLAYMSDFWLAGTSLIPHPVRVGGPDLFVASLDHALWLHAPHRVQDWLLFETDSPWAGSGRGFARGQFTNQRGELVATVAQEALIRLRSTTAPMENSC